MIEHVTVYVFSLYIIYHNPTTIDTTQFSAFCTTWEMVNSKRTPMETVSWPLGEVERGNVGGCSGFIQWFSI